MRCDGDVASQAQTDFVPLLGSDFQTRNAYNAMTSFVSSVLASARRTLAPDPPSLVSREDFFSFADASARENDMDLYSERLFVEPRRRRRRWTHRSRR